jgi:hypothetical protein
MLSRRYRSYCLDEEIYKRDMHVGSQIYRRYYYTMITDPLVPWTEPDGQYQQLQEEPEALPIQTSSHPSKLTYTSLPLIPG